MNESKTWKQTLGAAHPRSVGARDRHLRDPDRAAKAGQDRGEAVRRDAAAARRLRPALRQRPAARRREDAGAGVPVEGLTKGPSTLWDAPGMQRIKIPFGQADAPSSSTCWPTSPRSTPTASCTSPRARTSSSTSSTSRTRPTCMRRLAAVGITTREACGNTVRNVTACPYAGVCSDGGVRRHALRARADVLPAGPRRHAGLRAQVQGRVLGLQGQRRAA